MIIGPGFATHSCTPLRTSSTVRARRAARAVGARDRAQVRRRDRRGLRVHVVRAQLLVLGAERLVVQHDDRAAASCSARRVSKSERCIIVLASPSTSTAGLLPFAIVAPIAVGSIWPMQPKKPDACT